VRLVFVIMALELMRGLDRRQRLWLRCPPDENRNLLHRGWIRDHCHAI